MKLHSFDVTFFLKCGQKNLLNKNVGSVYLNSIIQLSSEWLKMLKENCKILRFSVTVMKWLEITGHFSKETRLNYDY